MVKILKVWVFGLLMLGSLGCGCRPARAADGWQRVGWSGVQMGAVTVSPQRAGELATVADGVLELSHDGGVVWLPCTMPARVDVVAYDPVQSGWLYAGTDTGLYASHDSGLSWQRFESVQTIHKITIALTVDNQDVFASMFDGAGTPVQIFRISRDGVATDTGFPAANASSFGVDAARQRLYVGAAGGVYWSDNEGATWLGGGQGPGSITNRVVVKPGIIWQLSADGLFRSRDDGQSWDRLAGPGDLNGTYYGSSMHLSGLAVSGDAAYYGDWSVGFPYQFLAVYAGGSARSVFDGHVNDVAIAGGRIWIATTDGLWVNNSLVGTEAAVRRPVIIVPGILGSLPTSEALKSYASAVVEEGYWDRSYKTPLELDPIDHTYDGLIDYLLARGYQRDHSLFVFPYNWMQDNAVTALQLAQKITDVKKACGCTQVDIVAHSMGGLIARSYIQSDSYQGDIANLIELATPNTGSVADYRVWESGEDDDIKTPSKFFNAILQALASPRTDTEKVVLVRQFMPAIGQLLPVFDYLSGRHYPVSYPRNQFLESLDQPGGITRLKQRVAVYVVGGNTKPTLQALTVTASQPGSLVWPDGQIAATASGLGDTTVLQSSLEAIDPASLLLDADHGGVVMAAAPFVAQTLMGGYLDDPDTMPDEPVPTSHYLVVYSSGAVALQVVAPGGARIDDTAIGVPGAYYSGSGTTPQIMAIPNPDSSSYQITVSGSGPYTIGVIDTDGSMAETTLTSSDQPSITSTLTAGNTQQFSYDPGSQRLRPYETGQEGRGDVASLPAITLNMSPAPAFGANQPPLSVALAPASQLTTIQAPSGVPPHPPHRHYQRHPTTPSLRWWLAIFGIAFLLLLMIVVVLQYE